MANQNLSFYIFFISLFAVCICDKCIQTSPCTCEYDDGRIIDLNPFAKALNPTINVTIGNLTYYFHPCTNIKLSLKEHNVTQNCEKNTSLCLYNHEYNNITNLALAKDSKFSSSDKEQSDPVYNLIYPQYNVIIELACTNIEETFLHAKSISAPEFILVSHHNCPQLQLHGLSTGSLLVILLLVFSMLYLFGGMLVLHCLRGATGREMIPNIDFWTDLPLLVRDGSIFLQNGCKPSVSPAETYDRI